MNTAGMDELLDHIHCEVEEARRGGLDDAAAFAAATARLGDSAALAREYRKNYGRFARIFQKLMRLDHRPEYRLGYRLFIANSLAWATAIILAALLASAIDLSQFTGLVITLLLIGGFFLSENLLRRKLRNRN